MLGFAPPVMPQAKMTHDLFWQSSARAHLIAALTQLDVETNTATFHGRSASCDINLER